MFYQCLSGTFYNLYDRDWGAVHCNAVYVLAIGGSSGEYSTAPPGPVSTGPSEATIADGGGTVSMDSTTGIGIGGESTSSRRPGSATATATSSGSGESAAATSSSSGGAAVPTGMSNAQKMMGWAAGIVGAMAVLG